ncbi:MAG: ribulokinase [Clostridia bacterium]|nr:ribulokinase [Clostridia bacterium]
MSKYSMGIDFGTLSARAVIVNIETKEEVAEAVKEYSHGVISDRFIDGSPLPPDYALQHPEDYLDCLYFTIKQCIEKSNINPSDIIGVGVDFTASTVLPVDECGNPLCFTDEFKNNPHAYVKLWKHHAAQKEADDINRLAKEMNAPWLERYGGTISSEWLFPKVLQILREDENLYNKTYRFIEAGDFIVQKLTGRETHSVCTTGFKAMWNEENGYPDKEFLKTLDERLENIVGDKLSADIIKLSETAGFITEEIEKITGLMAGTPVAPVLIDAHAALPALGVTKPGSLLMIIGTSTCHILLGDKKSSIPGISGFVKDGIVDGLYAYEAGQACVGDSFDWFVKNCVPYSYYKDAEEKGINIHKYLREKAEKLEPGSNGLIALDWWNGNRTPYVDGNLSGVILGLKLGTTPEEIYRALIEATAFGTRRIIEIYEQSGIEINTLYAAGGIAEKDPLLMQIYADVTGREIFLSGTGQACAYGSAVLGAVNENGYKTLNEACEKMKKIKDFSYKPNMENHEKYSKLYEQYKVLSEYFAKGDTMKLLKGRA